MNYLTYYVIHWVLPHPPPTHTVILRDTCEFNDDLESEQQ